MCGLRGTYDVAMSILDRILRAGEGRAVKRLEALAAQVNALEEHATRLSDDDLRAKTDEFRSRYAQGETLDQLLPEAFAVVREAARRTLGQRHYDVQLMGGAALHMGNIAEMRTGEGKTLVSTLPAYLNALSGKGVHIVTVNDYLAERDSEWMGRVHRFLGLNVACILAHMDPSERRNAYAADITYGTNNEFGFDYLRDNMSVDPEDCVQRGHNFAIVDEVDSILVDEARTPLIISGPADQQTEHFLECSRLAQRLVKGEDYEVDEKKRTVGLLESGITKTEAWFGITNLYESANTPLVGFINNAVKAKELFRRDRDYVVMDGEVLIVDEHTGRILAGRRYNDGMHQAIEAKEGVRIGEENQTLATITLQNYFRLYEKLSGMTGTAMTEAAEFDQIYKLGVIPIPTHRPNQRADRADLVYRTEDAKFRAVVEDIVDRHSKGQPILVGTTSVEKSEHLSTLLTKRGVKHEVLNAKNHAREASIVAQAGRKAAVTVATNMAGRGTDIMLGGNVEFIAHADLERQGLSPLETPEEFEQAWPAALVRAEESVQAEHDEVVQLGGLYVLGTERHESRRIDNQLRGRSGRQGDPGESRFYLSLQDDLMRLFKADMVDSFLQRFNVPDDQPIDSQMVSRAIASAQTSVEGQNFEIRKNVLKYDDVLNSQRKVVYAERANVLAGMPINDQIRGFVADTVTAYVRGATSDGYAEDWDLEQLWQALRTLYPVSISVNDIIQRSGAERNELDAEFLIGELVADAQGAYEQREQQLGSEVMREIERQVVLNVLDRKWREHLYEMDYLREGIGLRAMAQRDPLVEYQREGYDLFIAMMDAIKEETVSYVFHADVVVNQNDAQPEPTVAAPAESAAADVTVRGVGLETQAPSHVEYSAPAEPGSTQSYTSPAQTSKYADVGRNDPCPCGSGKKFKRCHGDPTGG
jgi:preprotein translocase subunit SecA